VTDEVPQGTNVSLTAKRQDTDGDGRLDGDGRVNLDGFVAGYGIDLIGGRDFGVPEGIS
jgi:hypothetical protein